MLKEVTHETEDYILQRAVGGFLVTFLVNFSLNRVKEGIPHGLEVNKTRFLVPLNCLLKQR